MDAVDAEMRQQSFAGRTELDVHRKLADHILEHGHQRVNFTMVGPARTAPVPIIRRAPG